MKKQFLLLALAFVCSVQCLIAQQMNVATYNLRNDSNTEDAREGNGWKQRFPVIASLIQFHDFDIFGTQEGLHHQLEDLKNSLPNYDYIGIGRDDGQQAGEYSAIFFKTNRFKLLKKGDFWLSTTTDKPNKGWDAALPRICSWGQFRDLKSGLTFYFFNLHMDHIGVQARSESSKLILAKIKEMTGGQPVILTGDFNVDQTSDSYAVLEKSGVLRDSYELSPIRYALNGTFNAFKTDSKTDSRIDHIFLSNKFSVTRYGILTDTYRSKREEGTKENSANFPKEVSLSKYVAREPSDHFPVMATITWSKK
ncbi:endonuclease [Chitinophaga silvatica]|uniref:Endonuclease n=1 Tax=Chitinophaga silvatica TaxID=2282649 RepID=A0A3E1Y4U9_9BACT|nr:endonuclease/exonuclease/phosphatase family protein [Chitinophaga silvatica]RFS19652.1 endonuclease [Chitinophaga silvatica]